MLASFIIFLLQEVPGKIIAGDNPVLWALVIAVGGLVTALGILWKTYQNDMSKKDEITQKAITAMVTLSTQNAERQRQLDRIEAAISAFPRTGGNTP